MTTYRLAVAARSFSKPSETFIRRHATELAPGATVLLCSSRRPPDPGMVPGPVLTAFNRWPRRRRIARFLRAHGAPPILAEYGTVGADIVDAAEIAGCRLFVHFHGYDASRLLRERKYLRRYRRMFGRLAGVFVPSRFIGDNLVAVGCPGHLITVTPCGVDPNAFAPSRRAPGRCLAVGRFVEKKAPLATLQAFATALETCPEMHLDMVGDGPLLRPCQAFAEQAGLAGKVTFHGARPHQAVRALMQEASIFLQHSVTSARGDTEGLPVAILEAMSSGLTVISTRHSGIPEAITDGEHGRLVAEHDVAGMAAALVEVMLAPDTAAMMAEHARQRVRNDFSAERSLGLLRTRMGIDG